MAASTMKKHAGWLGTPVTIILLLAVWQAYVTLSGVSPLILPAPGAVLRALLRIIQRPATWDAAWVTLGETVGGFAIAALSGIAMGVVLGRVAWLERAVQPVLVGVQVVPKIALVPLFIVWFGFGIGSKVTIAAALAFFPVFSNAVLGVRGIENGHREVMTALNAGPWQRFLRLDLPSCAPCVLAGMEMGVVLAIVGCVVGEFVGGNAGLGYLLVARLNAYETDGLFAVIVLLALVSFAFDAAMVLARRLLVPWHGSTAEE